MGGVRRPAAGRAAAVRRAGGGRWASGVRRLGSRKWIRWALRWGFVDGAAEEDGGTEREDPGGRHGRATVGCPPDLRREIDRRRRRQGGGGARDGWRTPEQRRRPMFRSQQRGGGHGMDLDVPQQRPAQQRTASTAWRRQGRTVARDRRSGGHRRRKKRGNDEGSSVGGCCRVDLGIDLEIGSDLGGDESLHGGGSGERLDGASNLGGDLAAGRCNGRRLGPEVSGDRTSSGPADGGWGMGDPVTGVPEEGGEGWPTGGPEEGGDPATIGPEEGGRSGDDRTGGGEIRRREDRRRGGRSGDGRTGGGRRSGDGRTGGGKIRRL